MQENAHRHARHPLVGLHKLENLAALVSTGSSPRGACKYLHCQPMLRKADVGLDEVHVDELSRTAPDAPASERAGYRLYAAIQHHQEYPQTRPSTKKTKEIDPRAVLAGLKRRSGS